MANRLYEKYKSEIVEKLRKDLDLNVMEVPKIEKISVNVGVGAFRDQKEALETFTQELADITGQKPFVRKARKSEAGFKIRKNEIVGLAVTLRGDKMWAFLDKLINVSMPRVRDFRGLSVDAFDHKGNYSVGIREHVIFPEINPNVLKAIRGLQVTIVTSAKKKEHTKELLTGLGFPFKKD